MKLCCSLKWSELLRADEASIDKEWKGAQLHR